MAPEGRTGAVLAAWEGGVGEHLLRDLSIELGGGVAEVALHIDELLEVVKLAIHLQHAHVLAVPACMCPMSDHVTNKIASQEARQP